jgi:hypothetical protein
MQSKAYAMDFSHSPETAESLMRHILQQVRPAEVWTANITDNLSLNTLPRLQHCLDNWLIDGGKVVSPTHFTPRKDFFLMFPVLISVRG